MKRSTLGALLILLLGLISVGAWKGLTVLMASRQEVAASDAGGRQATKVRIGGDGYAGYFFMNSPEMKRQAARRGIAVDFTNDGGDYDARLQKFNDGAYDAIVLPINSYLTHAQKFKYPGVIVAAIADSKGADGVACFADKLPTGKVTDLNDASLKIVYTAESPSSYLIDLAIDNFDLFNLRKVDTWRSEVTGSDKAYEKAKNHDGDCFAMWEPDLSRAMHDVPGLKKVWGSDQFSGYITDVFVFRRDYVTNHSDDLKGFFTSYFLAMRSYASDHARLVADMAQVTGLQPAEVEPVLKEIHWYNMQENATREFGLNADGSTGGTEGVFNSIVSITDMLVRDGKFAKDPLEGDPYKIINHGILQQVMQQLPAEIGKDNKRVFSPMSDADWKALPELGIMRVDPINFQAGTANLNAAGQAQVDKLAALLTNNYPDTRIVIRGHTGKGDDEAANVQLSTDRANAVMQRLETVDSIDPNRLKAQGMGSSQPPPRHPGENMREYQYRVPRVEFDLYQDNGSL